MFKYTLFHSDVVLWVVRNSLIPSSTLSPANRIIVQNSKIVHRAHAHHSYTNGLTSLVCGTIFELYSMIFQFRQPARLRSGWQGGVCCPILLLIPQRREIRLFDDELENQYLFTFLHKTSIKTISDHFNLLIPISSFMSR